MKDKLYIGISGKMGTGKSTLSDGIMKTIDSMTSTRVSMATPIKRMQDNIYRDLGIEMEGEKDRDLLIALGMWGRGKHKDFWLQQGILEIELAKEAIIICDDIRFENEANWFKKNGILMRIEGEQRGPNVDDNKESITETALDNFNFDYYIDNRIDQEAMIMCALYCIAQHLKVSDTLMAQCAEELHKEG